jgi:peptide chain release factor 2
VEVVDETPGDVVGIKSTTLLLNGPYAYGYARYESGVHRLVRMSPFDSNGARHTSFASVRVTPHFEDNSQDTGIVISPSDLKITTMRSQGAGTIVTESIL